LAEEAHKVGYAVCRSPSARLEVSGPVVTCEPLPEDCREVFYSPQNARGSIAADPDSLFIEAFNLRLIKKDQ
jgi:hypothetical protein